MKNKNVTRVLSTVLCGVLAVSACSTLFTSCKSKKDSIVIMTEELSGLFNPFYATSGADMDVVGMTQIGMLSTDSEGATIAGDNEPTVVKAFSEPVYNAQADESVYTFVIKNHLKFSDGHPLTMEDVLFNMYEYLDPVYTGSSTMYSIDIKGLQEYRTQTVEENADDLLSASASSNARARVRVLRDLYETEGALDSEATSFSMTEAEMRAAIAAYDVPEEYMMAVSSDDEMDTMTMADYRAQLLADYDYTLKTFKEELQADFKEAKESFDLENAPYAEHASKLSNDVFKFFLYENYITPKYAKIAGTNRDDKTKIVSFENEDIVNRYTTEEAAIERIYNDYVKTGLNAVLSQWGTYGTLITQYTADALDILLHNNMNDDGSLTYKNIEGIVSLGHTTDVATVTINGQTYKVAHDHDANGKPVNSDEYDVLQITINGVDPKAIYNFGFTVAPAHYYSADEQNPAGRTIDIVNNQFGIDWASSEFQSKVIQSYTHNKIPVGAGAFKATNSNNSDTPSETEFVSSNVVHFKANHNFMFPVKAEKLRMQVVGSSNAIDKLESKEVDFVTPQFTLKNSERLTKLERKGFTQLSSWQLGYGYIGINAGKVPNINVRRAIMSAMQTSLALEFYQTGTCKTIDWPMSTESWAYPFADDKVTSKPNGHDYTQWTGRDDAVEKIQKYMDAAGVSANDSQLKIKFTVAGASITEHPTYAVFKQAAELLNSMGWDVEVKADSQALTKLSTGSLEVWAAAWGSTIDPDMYQVYHKDSSATSVYAWGYREIKSQSRYVEEQGILEELSRHIEDARATTHQPTRKDLYEKAMGLVLDLAVELPVYQRMTLYAYNSKTIKGLSNTVNPYTSPLEKIWELELA